MVEYKIKFRAYLKPDEYTGRIRSHAELIKLPESEVNDTNIIERARKAIDDWLARPHHHYTRVELLKVHKVESTITEIPF